MKRSSQPWADYDWNILTGYLQEDDYRPSEEKLHRFNGDLRWNRAQTVQYRTDGEVKILDARFKAEDGKPVNHPFGTELCYHRYRLNQPKKVQTGSRFFIGALSDPFGAGVPDTVLDEIFDTCRQSPQHHFFFLTDNSERYKEYRGMEDSDHFWYGVRIDQIHYTVGKMRNVPDVGNGFIYWDNIRFDVRPIFCDAYLQRVKWIILGGCEETTFDSIKDIVNKADELAIPIFMLDSLIPVVEEKNMRREFPKELQDRQLSKRQERRLYENCIVCNKKFKRAEMYHLTVKKGRTGRTGTIGYICDSCMKDICKNKNIELPKGEDTNE